jgi:hypothetical protein
MAYFLRFVKECSEPDAWAELVATHAQLLDGMPTPGRSISWAEVATATLPLVGNAVAADVCRVSRSCACIGSPCLRHCVHGASIGGAARGGPSRAARVL